MVEEMDWTGFGLFLLIPTLAAQEKKTHMTLQDFIYTNLELFLATHNFCTIQRKVMMVCQQTCVNQNSLYYVHNNFHSVQSIVIFPIPNTHFLSPQFGLVSSQQTVSSPRDTTAINQGEWRQACASSETCEVNLLFLLNCCTTDQHNSKKNIACPLPYTWAYRWSWMTGVTIIDSIMLSLPSGQHAQIYFLTQMAVELSRF